MSLSFLRGQVGYMHGRGFRVHALSSPGKELIEFGERHCVEVHAVAMSRSVTPAADLAAVWRIASVVRRIRPLVVHAHTPKGGLLGIVAAWVTGVPVRIYHMRGLPLMGASGPKRTLLRWTEIISCRLANRVLCNSYSVRRVALEEGLCGPEKIAVLLNGSGQGVDAANTFNPMKFDSRARVDVRQRFGIPKEAAILGFVGRLVRDKGIIELAGAWNHLRTDYPDLHLLMVGPFEPQDPIPAEIRKGLQADPRVHWAGMDWNTPPLYSVMDVLALPTYREGFPNVLLEAAAMELPVVATKVPGCVDAVEDGVTGTLVPKKESGALSTAIGRYLKDPQLRRRHGVAGRERVMRDFRPEDIWEATYREYCRLLKTRGLSVPFHEGDCAELGTTHASDSSHSASASPAKLLR